MRRLHADGKRNRIRFLPEQPEIADKTAIPVKQGAEFLPAAALVSDAVVQEFSGLPVERLYTA